MGRETIFYRYQKDEIIPLNTSYSAVEPGYYFCGRDALSHSIYSYILRHWTEPTPEQEEITEKKEEETGRAETSCSLLVPHVTFVLTSKSKADIGNLGIRDFETPLYLEDLRKFADQVIDPELKDVNKTLKFLEEKLELAKKAASNAANTEAFEEFMELVANLMDEIDEGENQPAFEVFNIIHLILYAAEPDTPDGLHKEPPERFRSQVLRIFVSD